MAELDHQTAMKRGQKWAVSMKQSIMLRDSAISLVNEISKGNCDFKKAHKLATDCLKHSSELAVYCLEVQDG